MLWDNLNQNYWFKLYHDSNDYSCKTWNENGVVTIIFPNLEVDFASFTQELLHTYVELTLNLIELLTPHDSFLGILFLTDSSQTVTIFLLIKRCILTSRKWVSMILNLYLMS